MVVVAAMFTAGEEAASLLADDSRPIADYGAQSPAAAPSHARTRRYAAGALCALAVVALAGARDAPAPARAQTAFAARPALAWEAANEYTARLGAIAREYPWQGADFQVVDCLKPFSLALTVDHRAQETVAWSLEAPDREVSTYYGPRADHLRFEHCDEDFPGLFAGNFDRTRQPGDTLESIEAAAGKAPGAKASADAPAGASMTGEIPIEGGLSRNDASVYVAALSGGLEAVQEAKKDLRTQSGLIEKKAPASKQRVKDGSQVLELKVQETSGDALCYPDGATLFPALLQAKAGFHTGGKPWGGMLLTDRGQYGGLHSDHLDPTFTYDHLAALRPAVDGYDEMRDACAAGGDCAYHFKKTCTYEDAAMRGKDLAYSGVFSCSEACVVDRFYSIDDPALDLGPDERRSCAQPVLATLFNTPDLFKSCLTPDYDYTRGGAASGADGCHACIDACVDAYPGALTLSADSDAGCPASPGAYAALALEPRQA